ncbi:unnamed protein product [Cuscuta epithymum]|uniref:Aminotransferase-like plant mobile domain-containing protein n=1 Tax=Cuscuta epithymum TaxID=186058 RepID=A0AAV0EEW7_9ASTE|nr:unnamed protein product [Cuscuta epithymum]
MVSHLLVRRHIVRLNGSKCVMIILVSGHLKKDIIPSNTIRNLAIQRFPLSPWSTEIEIIRHTKTLIWQLLSGLLFPSTSGRASLYFLEFLHDNLENMTMWSWGSAVLAFLYHNVCEAAKADTCSMGGCLILLQLWAWERLPMVRPQQVLPLDAIFDLPYGFYDIIYYIVLYYGFCDLSYKSLNIGGLVHITGPTKALPSQ